jgi:hypothetical protein
MSQNDPRRRERKHKLSVCEIKESFLPNPWGIKRLMKKIKIFILCQSLRVNGPNI